MSEDLKKIRTPLIIASTVTVLALVYFGYQQYVLSERMTNYHNLTAADQLYISGEHEKAIEIYDELNQLGFLPDSILDQRKNERFSNKRVQSASSFEKELIDLVYTCEHNKNSLDELHQKSLSELVSELKQCFTGTKEPKSKKIVQKLANIQYLLINGDRKIHYFGSTKDDKANGKGVGVWENTGFYEGTWKDNMRHGLGKFTTEKGELYEGEYVNDRRNGKGTYYFRNGDLYIGEWKDSVRSGFGTVISAKGDTLVHGFWENDRFDRKRTKKQLGN